MDTLWHLTKGEIARCFSNFVNDFCFIFYFTVRKVHLSATSAVTMVKHGQVSGAVKLVEYTEFY